MHDLPLPTWNHVSLVMPEIWLALGMCAVLLVPFIRRGSVTLPFVATLGTLVIALGSVRVFEGTVARTLLGAITGQAGASLTFQDVANQSILGGMLAIDPFSQFFKILLLVFTLLVVLQWYVATRQETAARDTPDLLCLILGAALGMALMSSASNLLMIFVATESASFPSYALAGFRKRHRTGSEGSLKYVVFGAAASAVMVYGMSLIYGSTGSLALSAIAQHAGHSGIDPLMALGLVAMFAGFAFKLSAVPMHFWCPDVFQGAPTEVTTFLSVASKGAAICLLLRVLLSFGAHASVQESFSGLAVGVAILGAVTATWGNLVAIHQTQIKRLLAYSSIAHAGYMIMATSMVVYAGRAGSPNPVAGVILFYLLVYLFMNLGAFTVAAIVAQWTGTEDIREYAGLSKRSPLLAAMLGLFLFSLFGMPGLGGFIAKIYLAVSMTKAGPSGFVLIAVLFFNTLLSLYYYVRPVYYMYFVPDTRQRPSFTPQPAGMAILVICAVALLITGVIPSAADHLTANFATLNTQTSIAAAPGRDLGPRIADRGPEVPPSGSSANHDPHFQVPSSVAAR